MSGTISPEPQKTHAPFLAHLGAAQKWPLILLSIAAVALLLLQSHKTGFEDGAHNGYLSSHGIALAKNLVIGGNWLFMFYQKSIQPDGSILYAPYNPFPVFPFLLTGMVILPFEPHLAAQVMAARQLMNLFFIASMLLCFLLTRTLLHNAWRALIVTLLAFSSHYMLAYNDMIFNDVPALFGCMLALYMIVKLESGSLWKRTWLWVPIIAISMGWQPFATMGVWLLLDVLRSLWARQSFSALRRRPAVIVFAVALLWGGLVLTLQMLNEVRVMGGTLQNANLLQRALWRLDLRPKELYVAGETIISWPAYLQLQMNRTAVMLVPVGFGPPIREVIIGGALFFLLGVIIFRRQLSLFILAIMFLSYAAWAVLMKQFVTVHDFQSLYMISIAIAFFSVLIYYLRPLLMPVIAVVITVLFILIVYRINQEKNEVAAVVNPITEQFQSIYDHLPRESKLIVCGDRNKMGGAFHAVNFYLTGTYTATQPELADYLIIEGHPLIDGAMPLTSNPNFNLYQRAQGTTFSPTICDNLLK